MPNMSVAIITLNTESYIKLFIKQFVVCTGEAYLATASTNTSKSERVANVVPQDTPD